MGRRHARRVRAPRGRYGCAGPGATWPGTDTQSASTYAFLTGPTRYRHVPLTIVASR